MPSPSAWSLGFSFCKLETSDGENIHKVRRGRRRMPVVRVSTQIGDLAPVRVRVAEQLACEFGNLAGALDCSGSGGERGSPHFIADPDSDREGLLLPSNRSTRHLSQSCLNTPSSIPLLPKEMSYD